MLISSVDTSGAVQIIGRMQGHLVILQKKAATLQQENRSDNPTTQIALDATIVSFQEEIKQSAIQLASLKAQLQEPMTRESLPSLIQKIDDIENSTPKLVELMNKITAIVKPRKNPAPFNLNRLFFTF